MIWSYIIDDILESYITRESNLKYYNESIQNILVNNNYRNTILRGLE